MGDALNVLCCLNAKAATFLTLQDASSVWSAIISWMMELVHLVLYQDVLLVKHLLFASMLRMDIIYKSTSLDAKQEE